jgi:tetratricopeptide (TPR) repeat protein
MATQQNNLLISQLLQSVEADFASALLAAASLRRFDRHSLAAVMGVTDSSIQRKARTSVNEKGVETASGVEATKYPPDASTTIYEKFDELYEELTQLPFVDASGEAYILHDRMRTQLEDYLRLADPSRFRVMHERAAAHLERRLAKSNAASRESIMLEFLYHKLLANEADGISLFARTAEELTRLRLVSRLRALLNDALGYPLSEKNRLWVEYYKGVLQYFEGQRDEAIRTLNAIGRKRRADARLRAYALADLSFLLTDATQLSKKGGAAAARSAAKRSLQFMPEVDSKLVSYYINLSRVSAAKCKWNDSLDYLARARASAEVKWDVYAMATVGYEVSGIYALQGDWAAYNRERTEALRILEGADHGDGIRMRICHIGWPLVSMGRYGEAERSATTALTTAEGLGEVELRSASMRNVALAIGMQGRFDEANRIFQATMDYYQATADKRAGRVAATRGFWGSVLVREGRELEKAKEHLEYSIDIKREKKDKMGIPENLISLGELCELQGNWRGAADNYRKCIRYDWTRREYYMCAARLGLLRVQLGLRRHKRAVSLFKEAEDLALKHGYNDQLAALRLMQGG